jgi:amidophosphoribosyltransferase
MTGVFGVVSKKPCFEDLYHGTDYQSHMGTKYGGFAVLVDGVGKKKIHQFDIQAQLKSEFFGMSPEKSEFAKATSGIGVISAAEVQPSELMSRYGYFAVCTVGRWYNIDPITKKLMEEGWSIEELSHDDEGVKANPTSLAAKIVAKEETIEEGVRRLFSQMHGSLSLLILTNEGIYAARAKYGHSPLIIGKKEGEDTWAVTGETCAFPNLGYKIEKQLRPGEITLLTQTGPKIIAEGNNTSNTCAFLWVYTGFPASEYETAGGSPINVELARYRCGAALARRDREAGITADIVAGVPDSGLAHAIGYANESKIPLERPLVKYTDSYGRSYTPPTQAIRDKIAKFKLIPISQIIKGKRIVLCEDSIVRGTQLKNFTIAKLYESGAKEVHVRPACPPLIFPCRYGKSTRAMEELAARRAIAKVEGTMEPDNIEEYLNPESDKYRQMIALIMEELNENNRIIKTLAYQKLDDLVEAIGLPKGKLCTYCWDGKGVV